MELAVAECGESPLDEGAMMGGAKEWLGRAATTPRSAQRSGRVLHRLEKRE